MDRSVGDFFIYFFFTGQYVSQPSPSACWCGPKVTTCSANGIFSADSVLKRGAGGLRCALGAIGVVSYYGQKSYSRLEVARRHRGLLAGNQDFSALQTPLSHLKHALSKQV